MPRPVFIAPPSNCLRLQYSEMCTHSISILFHKYISVKHFSGTFFMYFTPGHYLFQHPGDVNWGWLKPILRLIEKQNICCILLALEFGFLTLHLICAIFRSARTSWITFVRPFVRSSARKIWISCIAL